MSENLFVYGSLAPGASMGRLLEQVGGTWQKAQMRGTYYDRGWSNGEGYPGVIPGESGEVVQGMLLTSSNLSPFWAEIDAYEGEDYERKLVNVALENGSIVPAYVYALVAKPLT
ncbi:gamma-glutamylcyclotransferase family protein [Polycladidibacter hongkongensis]|uniref:gamma-glutamylcyclotransferase family protein n=1 Tax=Polycladidibacter hongkongensis TaxID=1647556 RepID=UPI00082F810A|nr:gamma-glutamylcyclotransferase family protein [Pseudovibrio hongkongensis]